jgi:hypothetical protein
VSDIPPSKDVRVPDWLTSPYDSWPSAAKTMYGILGEWALREYDDVRHADERRGDKHA